MEIVHAAVVTEQQRKDGDKVLGWILGVLFAVVVGGLAVAYWKVTLAVLGVVLVWAVVSTVRQSRKA